MLLVFHMLYRRDALLDMHGVKLVDKNVENPDSNDEITRDKKRATIAVAENELVSRFGGANAEYIKGYTGIDNETGRHFAKSLGGIYKHKVNANPVEAAKNIKQQAGYSAEVILTSRDNAEAVISGSDIRVSRSDDLAQYGKNHGVVDRVKILQGEIVDGTEAQTKFVGNRDYLFKKIAEDTQKGDAKFSRYRGYKLELPSEQHVGAREFCKEKAQEMRNAAQAAGADGASLDVVERLQGNAKHYDQLADNLVDSGLTTEDVIFYRTHPKRAIAFDLARTSHRAGREGAKCGAVIGGCVSLLTNAFAIAQEKKSLSEAGKGVAIDTTKAAVFGYATAFTGSSIKGVMQQSAGPYMRTLSRTNAPTLALNVCLSLGISIRRYLAEEINEAELLEEVGEKGTGMLSAGMMAALGQLVIPVPFVGAAVGGMIGYTLSSMFYRSALDTAKEAAAASADLIRVREIEAAARLEIETSRAAFVAFIAGEFPELHRETLQLFEVIEEHSCQEGDAFVTAINRYAELLGGQLEFKSQVEFDTFMQSDKPLRI